LYLVRYYGTEGKLLKEVPMKDHYEDVEVADVSYLPIISEYAFRIGLVEEIDRLVECEMEISPGRVALAMVLDALSGRSPLFRVSEFFQDLDTELLLGKDIPASKLSDHTLGRVLDKLSAVGTNRVLGAIAVRVVKTFGLDTSHVHHDTTSNKLYGDYLLYDWEDQDQPFVITHGFSKEHRPDLKQLVHSLLCVDHGVPIYSKVEDGNASDKTINKNLIPEMVKRMRMLGGADFIYVADSALVTEDTLEAIGEWDKGFLFVSRLPVTYNECRSAIGRAVETGQWKEIGAISEEPSSRNRKPAYYRAFETSVRLYGQDYRAVVIHSNAYDERRRKRVDKQIDRGLKEIAKLKKKVEKVEYACLPDAQAAAGRLPQLLFHHVNAEIKPKPVYARGRPKKDGARRIKETRYVLSLTATPNETAIDKAREEAGCFVLLTNTPKKGKGAVPTKKLLTIYKDQHMVEQNFAFLKDPEFVNALFLKSPRRIEALGLILVLALMIWRLMERTMRLNLRSSKSKITGWKKRKTSRPTSFMMTTVFGAIFVLMSGGARRLAKKFTDRQLEYLKILQVPPDVFTTPAPH
jgi:transposase